MGSNDLTDGSFYCGPMGWVNGATIRVTNPKVFMSMSSKRSEDFNTARASTSPGNRIYAERNLNGMGRDMAHPCCPGCCSRIQSRPAVSRRHSRRG